MYQNRIAAMGGKLTIPVLRGEERDNRFIVRDVSSSPHWKCINDSWQEWWERPDSYVSHAKIFKWYDAVQRRHANWLPRRPEELKTLKKAREAMTYRTERLGGWDQKEAVATMKETFPYHMEFQEQILKPLCEFAEEKTWNRSFNPKRRSDPLKTRFGQYRKLAEHCL